MVKKFQIIISSFEIISYNLISIARERERETEWIRKKKRVWCRVKKRKWENERQKKVKDRARKMRKIQKFKKKDFVF